MASELLIIVALSLYFFIIRVQLSMIEDKIDDLKKKGGEDK